MARLTWAKQYLYGSHLNNYFNKNLCVFVCLQQVCNMSREYLPSSLLPDNKTLDMVHPITITSSVGAVGYLLACIRQAGQLAIWQARIFEIYQNLENSVFVLDYLISYIYAFRYLFSNFWHQEFILHFVSRTPYLTCRLMSQSHCSTRHGNKLMSKLNTDILVLGRLAREKFCTLSCQEVRLEDVKAYHFVVFKLKRVSTCNFTVLVQPDMEKQYC